MDHLQPDGARSFRLILAMIVLASVAVALRFFSKFNSKQDLSTKQKIDIGDVLMALALCFFYIDQGIFLGGISGPGTSGSSNLDLSQPQTISMFLKMIYIGEFFFVTTITTVKLSIVFFYYGIFGGTPRFRKLIIGLGGLCILWWLIALFIVAFQCSPIQDFWNLRARLTRDPSCWSAGGVVFGVEISNLVIDILILCSPIWILKSLQMTTKEKISAGSIFLLGSFICLTSCIRAYYTFDPSTGTVRSIGTSLDWSCVELATAIVCGCLPTYGRLRKPLTEWYSSLISGIRKSSQNQGEKTGYELSMHSSDRDVAAKYKEMGDRCALHRN